MLESESKMHDALEITKKLSEIQYENGMGRSHSRIDQRSSFRLGINPEVSKRIADNAHNLKLNKRQDTQFICILLQLLPMGFQGMAVERILK
ncbi:hypothetical protein KFK09_013886 [Dendrobium nobile]|uniref:Uncharacterized protein n=1 Tax=Dendrobium nobile TaxID=94219 RepID=A0A8T3BAB3_DENNO|nr:hypothetical protein KFK09_013886 [Dendrobium nobile]